MCSTIDDGVAPIDALADGVALDANRAVHFSSSEFEMPLFEAQCIRIANLESDEVADAVAMAAAISVEVHGDADLFNSEFEKPLFMSQ
jgi:hypothetical protein